jgi:hypothetical protein
MIPADHCVYQKPDTISMQVGETEQEGDFWKKITEYSANNWDVKGSSGVIVERRVFT